MAKSISAFLIDNDYGVLEYVLTPYATFPLATNEDLSKIVDTGSFMLPLTPAELGTVTGLFPTTLNLSEPLRPLTRIEITDGTKVYKHYVREDRVTTLYDVGDGELYQHNISTMEQKKLLELRPVSNMTVTQPRGQASNAFSGLATNDTVVQDGTTKTIAFFEVSPSNKPLILDGKTLVLISTEYTINVVADFLLDQVEATNTYTIEIFADGVLIQTKDFTYTFAEDKVGEIQTNISATYTTLSANEDVDVKVTVPSSSLGLLINSIDMSIRSIVQEGDNALITLEQVLDKSLLDTYDMNDTSYTPEFTMSDETRDVVTGISSPEFTFSGYTKQKIWEEVGDLIKGIERMEDNVISYDFINKINRVAWVNPSETKEVKQLTLDGYASSLEVNATNVIESIERQNTIVEPYANGWFTFRADQDGPIQITDTNVSIKTRFKNYEIKKYLAKGFLVTYVDTSTTPVTTEWDITDYVVEQKKWNTLINDCFDSNLQRQSVNLGKGNTIYFTKGGYRTKNFGYRSPKDTSILPIKEQSIYQIIASVATQISGQEVTSVQPNGGTQNIDNLLKTQYRVEHVATTTIRARVFKHDARDFPVKATLYTNESAKVNDTSKLGAYAQSLANRTGNRVRVINGIVGTRGELPEIGNIVGDSEIVTSVNVEMENGFYTFEATLYFDYTAINTFVGVDSEYRQFEVPDEDIVERDIIYTESITIATEFDFLSQTHSILSQSGFNELVAPFANLTVSGLTYGIFKTRFDVKVPADGDWNTTFDSESEGPIDVKNLGNTTTIKFKTKDNWSVDDNKQNFEFNAGASKFDKYVQNDYLYKDEFGNYDSARYELYSDGKVDNSTTDGDLYPEISQATVASKLMTVDIKTLADAREAINFNIDIPFFSKGNTDLRVYSGVAKYNGFALQDSNADLVAIVWNGDWPNQDEPILDVSQFQEVTSYTVTKTLGVGYIKMQYDLVIDSTYSNSFTGWGLINRNNNELSYLIKEEIQVVNGVTRNISDDIFWYTDETQGL